MILRGSFLGQRFFLDLIVLIFTIGMFSFPLRSVNELSSLESTEVILSFFIMPFMGLIFAIIQFVFNYTYCYVVLGKTHFTIKKYLRSSIVFRISDLKHVEFSSFSEKYKGSGIKMVITSECEYHPIEIESTLLDKEDATIIMKYLKNNNIKYKDSERFNIPHTNLNKFLFKKDNEML